MTIFCKPELFDLHQHIYIIDNKGGQSMTALSTIEDLPKTLFSLCYSKNIFDIHLVGNKSYLDPIVESIKEFEIKTYNNSKIKIGVN